MKKNLLNTTILTFIIVCLVSCKPKTMSERDEDIDNQDESLTKTEQVCNVVNDWNKTLNNRDLQGSIEIYAPDVEFYGTKMPGEEAAKKRVNLATKDPSWSQSITSEIRVNFDDNEIATAEFTKQCTSSKGVNTYPSYLKLQKINGKWKVVIESDKLTDMNLEKRKNAKIPKDAIAGDFDGDGETEHLWTSAKFDSEGYATTPFKLHSDNSDLESLSWQPTRGVLMFNAGQLNNDGHDYLIVIPYHDSAWSMCSLYKYQNGKWHKSIDDFEVWTGDDDYNFVIKSPKSGYVDIRGNEMSASEDDFDSQFRKYRRTVRLKI